jgi:ABC-type glycerol-3-phosphate transport system substrate-binding protein
MNFGNTGGMNAAVAGYSAPPEGQEAVKKYLASPEGSTMLQNFAGAPEGKKVMLSILPRIPGGLNLPSGVADRVRNSPGNP